MSPKRKKTKARIENMYFWPRGLIKKNLAGRREGNGPVGMDEHTRDGVNTLQGPRRPGGSAQFMAAAASDGALGSFLPAHTFGFDCSFHQAL